MLRPDTFKRLAVTAGAIALARVAVHLPIPGVDLIALREFYAIGADLLDLPRLNILVLGLMPYINASIVVEVLALFLEPLKKWRADGPAGRQRLRRTAYQVTLVFALIQGYAMAVPLGHMITPGGGSVMTMHGFAGKAVVALTLAGGTFFLLALAALISRRGIGHGVSLMIVVGLFSEVYAGIFASVRALLAPDPMAMIGGAGNFDRMMLLIGGAAALFGLFYLLVSVEQAAKRVAVIFPGEVKAALPLRLMPAGLIPASWGLSVVMIPFTVLQFADLRLPDSLMKSLLPGGVIHEAAGLILIVFFSFFFTALFHEPRRIVAGLKARGGQLVVPPGEEPHFGLDRCFSLLALGGGLYLGLLVLAGNLAYSLLSFTPGAVSLLLLVAIVLDLYGEGRFRQLHGPLLRLEELHDVNEAAVLQDLLRVKGIPCLLRGYHHRAMLYFFGPYLEISLLVPEEHREAAENLIAPSGSALET